MKHSSEIIKKLDLHVIVCTQFHKCIGAFPDRATAVDAALQMSKEGQCIYLPVPLITHKTMETQEVSHIGQYL